MKLQLLLACIAMVFVVPSSALATNSPEVTYPTGTKLAAKTKVQVTNSGESKLTWGATTITCSSAKWKGELTKNTGSEVEATVESATFNGGSHCSTGGEGASIVATPSKNGVPWCLRSTPELATDDFQVRGGACGKEVLPIRLAVNTTEKITQECVYERSGAIVGTYQTHPNDAVLTSNEVLITRVAGSVVLCPASMKVDTSFTLEKEEGSSGPSYISAGPQLTFPTGTTLATNSKLKGTSIGSIKMTTGAGTLECTAGELTGTLKSNSGTEIEADIESAAFTGICSSLFVGNVTWTFKPASNGLPWCLRATSAMAADEFQIRGNSCASASRPIRMSYEWTVTVTKECLYERSAALAGNYATHPEAATLSFKAATFLEVEPRSASCPDEAQLDSSMKLEQEAEGKPLYIS